LYSKLNDIEEEAGLKVFFVWTGGPFWTTVLAAFTDEYKSEMDCWNVWDWKNYNERRCLCGPLLLQTRTSFLYDTFGHLTGHEPSRQ
jgi:hypothetical protein